MLAWAMAVALAAGQAGPGAAASDEAEALGLRLAHTGALSTLMPMVVAGASEEIIGKHPEWSDADKATLRELALAQSVAAAESAYRVLGHHYATALSIADLRALVAFNESPAAAHYRAAEPAAIEAVRSAGAGGDLEGAIAKAMCAKTGKLCPG